MLLGFLYVICGIAYGILTWKRLEDKDTDINKAVIIFLYGLLGPCALAYEALKALENKAYENKNDSCIKFR